MAELRTKDNPSQGLSFSSDGLVVLETPSSVNSQSSATNSHDQKRSEKRPAKKSNQVCRFYGTKKGCRAGAQCPYRHVDRPKNAGVNENTTAKVTSEGDAKVEDANDFASQAEVVVVQQGPKQNDRTPVSKPISIAQQQNPREFQIGQVVRRFAPNREDRANETVLTLKFRPSDPDFPFELDELQCALSVPNTYPENGVPSLKVTNKEIPRGFQINVERGFDSLCSVPARRTLLQLMNDLDRNLERFLASEKAQTIKIIANRPSESQQKTVPPAVESVAPVPVPVPVKIVATARSTANQWTQEQKTSAKARREVEIRQLEARLGRAPLFSKSKDGIAFNVPLQIPKIERLPLDLRSLKELSLIVPVLYPLEPCRIKLKGASGPIVDRLETSFEERVREHKDLTLMAHINHLTQNAHNMAATESPNIPQDSQLLSKPNHDPAPSIPTVRELSGGVPGDILDEDRPHLRFISHPPPEWKTATIGNDEVEEDTSDESDTEEYTSDDSVESTAQPGGAMLPTSTPATTLEKGILLSFPLLELHGIELLELREISLSVKCDRCKTNFDVKNIKAAEPATTSMRTESCSKCASSISLSYRSEPMHANSIKAGYLDVEGCTLVDMLPSRFIPTCSECSTVQPLPGITSVRGDSPLAVCRECHHKLNFKIPEVKFLRVASNNPRLNLPLRSKRQKENLGITAGTQLPDRGRCKHYSKSYRWFRFSCCNRVYACDRCHDEKEEHPNEHANRMICGWCSREQNYRPEDCHSCGRSVIRKTGGGFWEGGKGTRDKHRMSRKDPRKYKRIGGGAGGKDT